MRNQRITTKKFTIMLLLGLIFTTQMLPFIVAQDAKKFGSNIKVNRKSQEYSDQVEPTMAILSTGRILVGWKEAEEHRGPGKRVGFAYSDNDGAKFSDYILMERLESTETFTQSDPWLVADSEDNAYFVFLQGDGGAHAKGDMAVAKTTDGGTTWLPAVNCSDTSSFDDKETATIDSEGNLYVAWTGPLREVRFTRSIDGGQSFIPTKMLAQNKFHSYIHASPNNTLYHTTAIIGGSDFNELEIIKSVDQGDTWTGPITLVTPSSAEVSRISVIDTDTNENVYIVYAKGTEDDKEILIIKSTDAGLTWSTPVQVNDVSTGDQRMPEMYIGQNDVIHVAWLDARIEGKQHYYYCYSTDGGVTFSEAEQVTERGFDEEFTRPGDYFCMRQAPNGDMCMVWTDGRNGEDHDIYFARQGLIKMPVWGWITLSGGCVIIIATTVVIYFLKRKRF
jgi:hypothetical protein